MAKESPLSIVPMFDVPKVEAIKNQTGIGTNPYISDAAEKYNQSIEDYANLLEQRYARPNLAKISAGFLKPQLGGFSASLGSAMEAVGEQNELERAIAPTVAQMRSQLALNRIAQAQGTEAAKIAEGARARGEIMNPLEAAQSAGLTIGPQAEATAGQASSNAQFTQLLQAMESGANQAQLYAKFPKDFVDKYYEIGKSYLATQGKVSGASGAAGVSASAPAAGAQSAVRIPGVPEDVAGSMPLAPQLAAKAQDIEAMQAERERLNTGLSKQADGAVPIFEASTNLYKAASNPDLEKAFGVFEKGDPLGALGKVLESGSLPRFMETARSQIISARLGSDREKRAISDLQAMEGALAELKVQMNNGVINPTDFRSVAEGESIPGIRNTQDAFLRGVARIGSTALTKYESKAAFDKALKDDKFNVREWNNSNYFADVQKNAQKRNQSLITNRASQELPLFMQKGLTGATSNEPKKSSGSGSPLKASDWETEARNRGLIK